MRISLLFTILLTALLLASCTATAEEETAPPMEIEPISETETIPETASPAVPANPLRITEGGTHTITGVHEGMLVVNAGKEDVTLVLDGAEITAAASEKAAVYVKNAGSVTILLADGSENRLTVARASIPKRH